MEEAEEDEPETWADCWYQDKHVSRVREEVQGPFQVRKNMKKTAAKSSLKG
ncbi:Hypothetical protein FKW44_014431 [Caligus rogercresseyi]|uniref:Uncharacterized protein n=1 Tax=Caligus rogercresseyi TaxID=217165 RepID=A0A7T8JZX1_CALRO|nr:Hypothetical protein FKW44_014431 [Caligus rogercresseyi]